MNLDRHRGELLAIERSWRDGTMSGINKYLGEIKDQAEEDLTTSVTVEQASGFPTPSKLHLEKPVWKKIDDAVVVATDLKGSTKISYSKQDHVGARVYQASTGNCARIFQRFDAQFVDIQGDGLFGIFHGELAVERAIACAFTLKSFSARDLADLIDEHLGGNVPEGFETGLKIGVDAGTILAKRIGVRGEHNEPVWAGKPVNYATKCAKAAEAHEIILTDRYFKLVGDNDYVRYSCGCDVVRQGDEIVRVIGTNPGPLWSKKEVETLGDHSSCKNFPGQSSWCVHHGDTFCAAIETGETEREDLAGFHLPELADRGEDGQAQAA